MDTKIRREEIFAPNRDELFMCRLNSDIEILKSCGLSDDNIRTVIGTFQYVKVWINTPTFLYPCLKLPKGYIWKDATKIKYGKSTYWLYPIGKDLYVKGIVTPGTHISDPKISIIKNWKKLKGIDVAKHFDCDFHTIILNFWKEHNLELGFIQKITRRFDISEAILKQYRSVV